MEPMEDWLSARAESPQTRTNYLMCWKAFSQFCHGRMKDPLGLVAEYRTVKYQGPLQQKFLDEWQDVIRAYSTYLKTNRFAPTTVNTYLAVVKSFVTYWKIPLDVDLPRHPCVLYHNRDMTKEQVRQILSHATPRDRTIWLLMAESGLRAGTAVTLKYWQIQDDFEKGTVPLRILTPAETLKDHVGDRWSFIGEDGYRALKEYLAPRIPLKGEDFVFASELPGKATHEPFSVASLSVKFSRITRKLKMERGAPIGKPGHIRMHGLRKYFRNNMRADASYREFWMGHSLGVDAHYVSRDPEFHRSEYKKNYEDLRILEPTTPTGLKEIQEQLKTKDTEIRDLRTEVERLSQTIETQIDFMKAVDHQDKAEMLKTLLKLINQVGKEPQKEPRDNS
jgi:integrase